jgi:HEAT repeat protein/predicted HTH domain antitoxin
LNETLKALCGLLQSGRPEDQRAAAHVLARIRPEGPEVSQALAAALAEAQNPELVTAFLDGLLENPHANAIPQLLEAYESETVNQTDVSEAIARVGPEAPKVLRAEYAKADEGVRAAIAELLPRIRTAEAMDFLLETFQDGSTEVIRSGVHGLREEIGEFIKKEKGLLYRKLRDALDDPAVQKKHAAFLAVIISLGIVADPRSKKLLLPYVSAENDDQTRRYALLSLAQLQYSGSGHGDLMKAVLPILEEEDETLVRYAVDVLSKVPPRKSDAPRLEELLENPHSIVQAYAVRGLGGLDTVTHARRIVGYLYHRDHNLRDAAREALSGMKSATGVLLEMLEEPYDEERCRLLASILSHHASRINRDKARELGRQMFEYLKDNDGRYQTYRAVLLAVEPQALRDAVNARLGQARKRGDWPMVRDCLRLLADSEFFTPEVRYQLAIAKLKTSRKEFDRASRLEDYALTLIAEMLAEEGKPFVRKFLAEEALELEDYYYVGFHFAERLNEERRFGADVLRHVLKQSKRSKLGRQAKEKLRVEGH